MDIYYASFHDMLNHQNPVKALPRHGRLYRFAQGLGRRYIVSPLALVERRYKEYKYLSERSF
jgi:hypothetical protein